MYAIRSIGIGKMISTFDTVSLFHITAPFSIPGRVNVMFQAFILIFLARLGLMCNRQAILRKHKPDAGPFPTRRGTCSRA